MRNRELRTRNFELITALICGLFILAISAFAHAESIDDIRIIKISSQDQRAIIKTQERELRIIKVGDKIQVKKSYQLSAVSDQPENGQLRNSYQQRNEQLNKIVKLKVVEIAKGRVVLEEETEKGIETIIMRLENGKQTVERIKRTPDEQPVFYKTNNE